MVSWHHGPDWLVPKRPMTSIRQIARYQIIASLILGKFKFRHFEQFGIAFRSDFGQFQNFQPVIYT